MAGSEEAKRIRSAPEGGAKKGGDIMATELELRERQRNHLGALLKIKRVNGEKNQIVYGLDEAIENAIIGMEDEDIAIVETRIGVKARQ
jgi:hypothetical protein